MTDQYWSPAKQDLSAIPFRNKFDGARDPLTARNAIGALGEAPSNGQQYAREDGAWTVVDTSAAAGSVVGAAYAEYTTYTTTTATMAGGVDTIPQNTDGAELLTVSITPKATTNKLRIHASLPATASLQGGFWAAIFRDSTAAAIAATAQHPALADSLHSIVVNVEVTAGSTSATTFKLRLGSFTGGGVTLAVNGNTSARRLGGAQRVVLTVLEIAA